jgi:hypothetical protein
MPATTALPHSDLDVFVVSELLSIPTEREESAESFVIPTEWEESASENARPYLASFARQGGEFTAKKQLRLCSCHPSPFAFNDLTPYNPSNNR